jgi:ATP diphosphatase
MPALTRAIKLQEKAARVGFDWPGLGPVLDKMREEVAELEDVLLVRPRRPHSTAADTGATPTPPGSNVVDAAVQDEFGDLLFTMANVARHLRLDPEAALRGANDKFCRRFRYVEARLAERGKTPAQSTLDEMDELWNEVRARDKE